MKVSLALGIGSALVLLFSLTLDDQASAATYTWAGNGSDGKWSTAANWTGTAPVSPGSQTDVIVFAGSPQQMQSAPDLGEYTLTSLRFDSSALAFRLSEANGNLVFAGAAPSIVQTSQATQTLEIPIRLLADTSVGGIGMLGGGLTITGDITGQGGLIKTGSATLNLSGTNQYAGSTTVAAGTLRLHAAGALPSNSAITVNQDATLDLNGFRHTASAIAGAGSIWLGWLTPGELTLETASTASISTAMIGNGTFIKSGMGVVTLEAELSSTISTVVKAGRLILRANGASSAMVAQSGGVLRLEGTTLSDSSTRSLRAEANGIIEYSTATVNGGYLQGPGMHAIVAGGVSTLNGATINNGAVLQQAGSLTLNNVISRGRIASNASLDWRGGLNGGAGELTVGGTCRVQEWENDGVLTIISGGILNNCLSNLVSAGGSRITVDVGGQLNADSGGEGCALDLLGSLLVNNGTVTGTTKVHYGATVKGSGTFGSLHVFEGGAIAIAPGNALSATEIRLEGGSITGAGVFGPPLMVDSSTVHVPGRSDTLSLTGALTGSGQLVKDGAGTVILAGIGSYAGGTKVVAGTLRISGSHALPVGRSLTIDGGATVVLCAGLSANPAGAPATDAPAVPIPEPGTLELLASSMMILVLLARRARK